MFGLEIENFTFVWVKYHKALNGAVYYMAIFTNDKYIFDKATPTANKSVEWPQCN